MTKTHFKSAECSILKSEKTTENIYIISLLKVFCLVVGCWITGLTIASTFMLESPAWTQFLGFATFSATQFFSFVYIVIAYIRIQRTIAAHFKNQREINDEATEQQVKARLAQERSHNLTLLMIVFLFVIVWFPFMVVLIIGTVYQASNKRPGSWMQDGFVWTAILTYVNGAINPFIYAVRYRELGLEIRRRNRKLFFCCRHHSVGITNESSRSGTQEVTLRS